MAGWQGGLGLFALLRERFFPSAALRAVYALYGRLRRATDYPLQIECFGAGEHPEAALLFTTLGDQTQKAATCPLKGTCLYLFVRAQKPARILELGTHLGLGTLYLFAAAPQAEIHTIEASPTLAAYARRHFALFGGRIKLHPGRFEEVLPTLHGPWDLIYIDGNHRSAALHAYIAQLYPHLQEGGWFVCDDIFWSRDMWQGWQKLRHQGWRTVRMFYPFGFLQK